MAPKQEKQTVYSLTLIMLIIGVLCYAGIPAATPEQPVRLVYKGTAGKVLFDHKTHLSETGYGISCIDCHHHPGEDDEGIIACGDCHLSADNDSADLPKACMDCHEADEIEGSEMMHKTDSIHSQCIGCHKDYESGPEQCASCHVM